MEIKDALKNNLKGEALANALSFTNSLVEKGLAPKKEWDNGFRFIKNGKSPCLFVFNNEEWFICDVPVVSEPEWSLLNDNMKEFIIAHIKTCSVHQGKSCGCGSEPGITKSIFGKRYNNVCTSEIHINNPSLDILDKFKEIIEWWVVNIGV